MTDRLASSMAFQATGGGLSCSARGMNGGRVARRLRDWAAGQPASPRLGLLAGAGLPDTSSRECSPTGFVPVLEPAGALAWEEPS